MSLIARSDPRGHKATDVAEYVLWLAGRKGKSLTPMQLIKLVYLIHGWTLGLYGRPAIREGVKAWKYGPVIPAVYHEYKKFRGNEIWEIPDEKPTGFATEEESLMEKVVEAYRNYSGPQLSTLTHSPHSPWAITTDMRGQGATIPDTLIELYFGRQASKEKK